MQAFKKTRGRLTLKKFERNLYTGGMPNPDILIRTGGYKRLSNFLLCNSIHRAFFVKKLWPDFKTNDLIKIIKEFKRITRNYGKV